MESDAWSELSERATAVGGLVAAARAEAAAVAAALGRSGSSFTPEAAHRATARELAVQAAALRRAAEALDVYAAAAVQTTAAHRDDAERSATSWLARHLGQSGTTAARSLRAAAVLDRLPDVAAAFATDQLTVGHLDAISRIVPSRLSGERLDRTLGKVAKRQGSLIDAARDTETVDAYARYCREVRDRLDADDASPDDSDDGDDSGSPATDPSVLDLSPQPNGRWKLFGDLTADDGALLATMIGDQIVKRRNARLDDGDDRADGRPYPARQAEALLDLVCAGAAADRPGRIGIFVHIDIDDYIADAATAQPDLADLFRPGRAHTEAGLDITDATLWAWMAGDRADITPIFSSGGTPLSYGRTRRTAPQELRRAIAHRDRTCVFPNCDSPFHRNHAHHLREWEDGGTTDPDNVAGACPINHLQDTHTHGWQIRRTPDGKIEALRPDGTVFDPTPRWRQEHAPTRERRRHEGDAASEAGDAA